MTVPVHNSYTYFFSSAETLTVLSQIYHVCIINELKIMYVHVNALLAKWSQFPEKSLKKQFSDTASQIKNFNNPFSKLISEGFKMCIAMVTELNVLTIVCSFVDNLHSSVSKSIVNIS